MTFKEKLKMEQPEKVNEKYSGGCQGCPSHYEYEEKRNCVVWESDEKCTDCWNREIPGTEPKPEIDAADYISIYTEGYNKGHDEGLNDAWELAKQILYGIDKQIMEIFDVKVEPRFFDLTDKREIINNHTPKGAKARIEKWREEQSKIEVGDVVESEEGSFVVSNIVVRKEKITYFGIAKDGKIAGSDDVKKTGKHIDIKSILEQIGE